MGRQGKIKLENIVIKSSGIVLLLFLWELSAHLNLIDTQFLPPVSAVLSELAHLLMSGELIDSLLISLWRIVSSLLLATIAGVPLGILLQGWFPRLTRDMDSFFHLLSHVNPFSLSPLFLLLFGIGETQKLAIIGIVALWPILFHTITGVRCIDPAIIKTARSMKVTAAAMAVKVLAPAAFPAIMTGLRISTQLSVFMLTGVEMLDARTGLGALVHGSAMEFDIPRLYAGGVLIILLGIVLIQILAGLEKEARFWYEPAEGTSRNLCNAAGSRDRLHGYYVPLAAGAACSIIIFGSQLVQQQSLNHTAAMPKMEQGAPMPHDTDDMGHSGHNAETHSMDHHMDMDQQNGRDGNMNHHMDMEQQDSQDGSMNHHMDMDQDSAQYDVMLHPSGGAWPANDAGQGDKSQ